MLSCEFCEIFKNNYLKNSCERLLLKKKISGIVKKEQITEETVVYSDVAEERSWSKNIENINVIKTSQNTWGFVLGVKTQVLLYSALNGGNTKYFSGFKRPGVDLRPGLKEPIR